MKATDMFSWLSGSEMGGRIRAFDWSQTPLGPIEQWPASLVSILGVCLTAQTPMAIYWGVDGWLLYNDAWRPVVGGKHPWALGHPAHEVWPELWPTIQHYFESVHTTGEANWRSDELLPMQRFGFTEECCFDYSLNPIRGQSGAVEGILNIVQETTYRVLNDRRTSLLRELASLSGSAQNEQDACARILQALATDPADIPFALLYHIDRDQQQARLAGAVGLEDGGLARHRCLELAEETTTESWPLAAALRQDGPLLLEDASNRFGLLPGGAWPEPARQCLLLPITTAPQTGKVVLVAGVSPRRPLDDHYHHFFRMLGSQIAGAINNARAYQSEQRRAEALAELDRAKTAFFSNVSHELRTPLTLMLGPLEEELRLRPQSPALEVAHRNSVRLLKLVNTLLDFSRIEAGRTDACYQPTDLAAYSADLASGFRSAVEKAGVTFIVECPPLPDAVYVDRTMWEQIVLNLLSNAFKHTFHGHIRVLMRHDAAGTELVVSDTGVGIPDEAVPRLFERFYRVHNRRSRTHEGTGIGLALVQEVVRLHGGTVQVESRLDEGSTFRVKIPWGTAHLPAEQLGTGDEPSTRSVSAVSYIQEALHWLPETQPARPPAADSRAASPSATRPRVVVADDNADMRHYIERLLSSRYDVVAVGEFVLPVVGPVVFDADLPLRPRHIDPPIDHEVLGLGPGQAGAHQDQAHRGLLLRLGPAVRQVEDPPEMPDLPRMGMSPRQGCHRRDRGAGRIQERIHPAQPGDPVIAGDADAQTDRDERHGTLPDGTAVQLRDATLLELPAHRITIFENQAPFLDYVERADPSRRHRLAFDLRQAAAEPVAAPAAAAPSPAAPGPAALPAVIASPAPSPAAPLVSDRAAAASTVCGKFSRP